MTHLPPIGNIFFHTVSVCIQHLICSRKNDNTELNLKNFASAIRKKSVHGNPKNSWSFLKLVDVKIIQ